jgi:hypothetical protein
MSKGIRINGIILFHVLMERPFPVFKKSAFLGIDQTKNILSCDRRRASFRDWSTMATRSSFEPSWQDGAPSTKSQPKPTIYTGRL